MSKEDIIKKYKEKLEEELGRSVISPVTSREYKQFKKEMMSKKLSIYEKLCNISEKILKIKPDKKKKERFFRSLLIYATWKLRQKEQYHSRY